MRCFFLTLAFFGLTIWLIYPTDRTLATWTEKYPISKNGARYQLMLVERDLQLFYGPFERRRELRIRNALGEGVMHIVPVELFGQALVNECKSTCEVNWVAEGVEFVQSSGHRLFIPASAYTGGR